MSRVRLAVSTLYREDDFQLKARRIQWKLSNRPVLDCTRRPVLEPWARQHVPRRITAIGILIPALSHSCSSLNLTHSAANYIICFPLCPNLVFFCIRLRRDCLSFCSHLKKNPHFLLTSWKSSIYCDPVTSLMAFPACFQSQGKKSCSRWRKAPGALRSHISAAFILISG